MRSFQSTVSLTPFPGIYPKAVIIDMLLKLRMCMYMLIGVVGHLMHWFPGNQTGSPTDRGHVEPQHVMFEPRASFPLCLLEHQLHCWMRWMNKWMKMAPKSGMRVVLQQLWDRMGQKARLMLSNFLICCYPHWRSSHHGSRLPWPAALHVPPGSPCCSSDLWLLLGG